VISLEGCERTAAEAKRNLSEFGISNVDLQTGEFDTSLKTVRNRNFDLIYFDGNHQKDATLRYFELLLETANNDSVWIFDDIHWSPEMSRAWETIQNHPKITVAIDTFQWGFVFFRKEQQKETFTIRA